MTDKQCTKPIGHIDKTQWVLQVKTWYTTPHSNGIICVCVLRSSWPGHKLFWPVFVIWFPSIPRGKCQIVRDIVLDLLPHSESFCHWSSIQYVYLNVTQHVVAFLSVLQYVVNETSQKEEHPEQSPVEYHDYRNTGNNSLKHILKKSCIMLGYFSDTHGQ